MSRKGKPRETDLCPKQTEINNCTGFLQRQLAAVAPKLIVLLGTVAIKQYLRLNGRRMSGKLEDWVGKTEPYGAGKVIFFPHTSRGSRWHNEEANRQLFVRAQDALRVEISRLQRSTL